MKLRSVSKVEDLNGELLENAADWFIRVRTAKVDSDEHAQWLQWIEADPKHRSAFTEIQEAWNVAGELNPHLRPLPSLKENALTRRELRGDFSSWRRPIALAASLAVAVLGFFTAYEFGFDSNHVTTRRGEQQSTLLPDGSRVELGGQTGVALDFTDRQRLVVADEGEAFYKVAHDPKRPFIVKAGPVSVTAIGTAFSIRREGDVVSVVVTEGAVSVNENAKKVAPVLAKAGQRVRFNEGQLSTVAEPVKTEVASTWRRGRLRFEEEPLSVVVASLNRYSNREIKLADAGLADLKFTGTVFDDRVEDWLSGVQKVFPVKLKDAGENQVEIVSR